jgi:hypothetical protein
LRLVAWQIGETTTWPHLSKATSKHRRVMRSIGAIRTSSTKSRSIHEMERVFDICHGCRRCVSLCQSFPNLFDLVDGSESMEVDGVKKEDYWQVVDHCYLCDLCYMTKCPYVPPHEWNLDFPHLMLRAKGPFPQGRDTAARQGAHQHRRCRPFGRHPGGRPGGQRRQQDRPGTQGAGSGRRHTRRRLAARVRQQAAAQPAQKLPTETVGQPAGRTRGKVACLPPAT